MQVEERLTVDVHGPFHGLYRLLPDWPRPREVEFVIAGEHDRVGERDLAYLETPNAAVDSPAPPGTWGLSVVGFPHDWAQIVWHAAPRQGRRTFVLWYSLRDFVTGYRDVADLVVEPWGGELPLRLGHLRAVVVLPGPVSASDRRFFRAVARPRSAEAHVRVEGRRVVLDADDVAPHRFVELETTFPRRLLTRPGGFQVRNGAGLPALLDRGEAPAFGATPAAERHPIVPRLPQAGGGESSIQTIRNVLLLITGLGGMVLGTWKWLARRGTRPQ